MGNEAKPVAPNKGGRPRKDPAKGKRGNYAFRMSDLTRGLVGKEADEAGRSLSEEIEYRVEKSLAQDGRIEALMTLVGGKDFVMFASMVNADLRIAIDQANKQVTGPGQWFENAEKLEIVKRHLAEVVGRTVGTFASMVQTGVASRVGDHAASRSLK